MIERTAHSPCTRISAAASADVTGGVPFAIDTLRMACGSMPIASAIVRASCVSHTHDCMTCSHEYRVMKSDASNGCAPHASAASTLYASAMPMPKMDTTLVHSKGSVEERSRRVVRLRRVNRTIFVLARSHLKSVERCGNSLCGAQSTFGSSA